MRQNLFKICAGLLLITIAALIWFGFNVTRKSSAGADQSLPPQTVNKEAVNNKKLGELLKSDDISVDDTALLPTQVEKSNTIFMRLKSDDLNELSAEMSENVEVSLLKVKNEAGALSRQRFLELSRNQVLVVAVNDQKQVLWWNLQPDPRVFRAETSDDNGQLSGKTLYRQEAEILVSLPADESITEVRFYHPAWDGISTYSLKQIGSLNLR